MSYANGIISAPVDVSDPYYCLGVGQYNGWWDLAYINSNAHGKTNPYAKYKPVELNSAAGSLDSGHFTTVNSKKSFKYSTDWWRSISGNCGLVLPNSTILRNPNEPDEIWSYEPPTINNNWHRSIDWDGYNHKASDQLIYIYPPSAIYENRSFQIGVVVVSNSNSEIGMKDLFGIGVSDFTDIGVYISLRSPSNPNETYEIKKIDINIIGQQNIKFENTSLGGIIGSTMWLHAYAQDSIGRIVSIRTNKVMNTSWAIPIRSTLPYGFEVPRGQVLRNQGNPYTLYLWNLRFGITGYGFAGGTLQAGSYLRLYKFIRDDMEYQNESPLWSSIIFGALTVASEKVSLLPLEYTYTVDANDSQFNTALVIWFNEGGQELARLKSNILFGNPTANGIIE